MTRVLAVKPGHDGSVAYLDGGELVFLVEAEKDSKPRYAPLTAELMVQALGLLPAPPDVVALGGWYDTLPGLRSEVGAGYTGLQPGELTRASWMGHDVQLYSSSHERSHLFCGVGLSGLDPQEDIAILVWEGVIGSFYKWARGGASIERFPVLDQPGARFAALYAIADAQFPEVGAFPPAGDAGKLMAIAGLSDGEAPSQDAVHVVSTLLKMRALSPFDKRRFRGSSLYNAGVTDPEVCRAAKLLSDEIFVVFEERARAVFATDVPLVVVGGCGLNCEWNSRWEGSGIFSSLFVPPCTNDSGSALGTAVDAWVQVGGRGTVEWDVYRGPAFVRDADPTIDGWTAAPMRSEEVAARLVRGEVVAWAQGRAEIGPRALGHRSLLASAQMASSLQTLNDLKGRESYRPIAPVCLEEDLGQWFEYDRPDPYMLRFNSVKDRMALPAVTHADGSARVQSVTDDSCRPLADLLRAVRATSGVGVLCNTSLNFNGTGFINRTSHLMHYCNWVGIDSMVIDDVLFSKDHGGVGLRPALGAFA